MTPAILYFGFHRPTSLLEAWRRREWTVFGHVEAWGVMDDGETWFFFDPVAKRSYLAIEHRHDEVDTLLALRFLACERVLKLRPPDRTIRLPFHPMMNCVSQCAHLAGLRAYHPRTFYRMLLAHGAEAIQ
jgi:hypothetical protein